MLLDYKSNETTLNIVKYLNYSLKYQKYLEFSYLFKEQNFKEIDFSIYFLNILKTTPLCKMDSRRVFIVIYC